MYIIYPQKYAYKGLVWNPSRFPNVCLLFSSTVETEL